MSGALGSDLSPIPNGVADLIDDSTQDVQGWPVNFGNSLISDEEWFAASDGQPNPYGDQPVLWASGAV